MTTLDPQPLLGRPVNELTTPCVVVDANALEYNLKYLADYFAGRHCRIRPHFKSHKCVALARRQLAAGSTVGITAAKLSEAEQLVAGGVTDVLIANQVVGAEKARRLAALNRQATVRAAVDSAVNVEQLEQAARDADVTIGVLVEVDIGMGRCGVPPGQLAIDLARKVADAGHLRFDGLQGYEGHLVQVPDPEERRRRVIECMEPLLETRKLLADAGLPVTIVSGGGTGTYDVTGNIAGVDEVQCGSYALMDAAYRKIRPEFEVASSVLTTVISVSGGKAIADVGRKGLGCEFGLPVVAGDNAATVTKAAEEHAFIENCDVRIGDKLQLIPSHGCTTHNLYRRMWITRDGIVEDCWPIEGSGCLE